MKSELKVVIMVDNGGAKVGKIDELVLPLPLFVKKHYTTWDKLSIQRVMIDAVEWLKNQNNIADNVIIGMYAILL